MKQSPRHSELARWVSIATVLGLITLLITPTASAGSPSQTFSFPYSYGTPTVPKGVGAQGVQGPTVPLSSVGLSGSVGPSSTVGPVSPTDPGFGGRLSRVPSTVTITVENGTHWSSSAASHQLVTMRDLVNNTNVSAYTSSAGAAVLHVWKGWFGLNVYASNPSSYVNFYGEVEVTGSSLSLTRYLLPVANVTSAVDNPASSTGVMYIQIVDSPLWDHQPTPQLTVELWNYTTGEPLLTSAVTGDNGTAIFTHTNPAYGYEFSLVGNTSQSMVNYGISGCSSMVGPSCQWASGGPFFLSGNRLSYTLSGFPTSGVSTTTGTTTGSPLPKYASYPGWTITQNTELSGGTTTVSTPIAISGGPWTLTFSGEMVYWNVSSALPAGLTLRFLNSTVLVMSCLLWEAPYSGPTGDAYLSNSVTFGPASFYDNEGGGVSVLPEGTVLNSYIMNSTTYGPYSAPTGTNYTGDILENIGGYTGAPFVAQHLYADWFIDANVSVDMNHVSVASTHFDGGGVYNSTEQGWGFSENSTATFTNDYVGPNTTAFDIPEIAGANVVHCQFTGGVYIGMNYTNSVAYEGSHSYTNELLALGPHGNVSLTLFNLSVYSGGYVQPRIDLFSGSSVYDSYFDTAQITDSLAASWAPYPAWSFKAVQVDLDANVAVSYTEDDGGYLALYGAGNKVSILHDHFEPWGIVTSFQPSEQGSYSWFTVSNSSWGQSHYNWTLENLYGNVGVGGMSEIACVQNCTGNVTYDTFDNYLAGGGPGGETAYDVGTTNWAYLNITNNLFDATESGGPSYPFIWPVAQYIYAFTNPEGATKTTTYNINGDWFLSLSGKLSTVRTGGYGPAGLPAKTSVRLTNCHFYEDPAPGTSYVPVDSPTANLQLANNSSYAFFVNGGPLTFVNGPLVWNTSYSQLYKDPAGIPIFGPNWLWDYAPDVNTTSGTPVVSYVNGFVAGPQPNFPWHGYNYTESVEPSYIAIGVNSSRAPPVTVSLSTAPGTATLAIYNSSSGTLLSTAGVAVPSSGTYNATFYPSNESSGVVFELVSENGFGVPGFVNFAPVVELVMVTMVAAVIIYIGTNGRKRRRHAAWKG